ncbi:autotransporter-associated beta strand repeat-containing protein [Roseimicrobium sp. ORNL1]|uniref:beta strand repeat-containing protein n=1 Tax=Roseimicrobium sp. ORNL1 TaxID=2711231 RepID=UPI0013E190FE|nr:autotransporter-associated beta strand repeat-containing protein [Roseimicrobium sp. ORNL1]QIF01739.1 PEP-CTERM sorting domain-containing protein [Roseimicrobium sp. ORNL1]
MTPSPRLRHLTISVSKPLLALGILIALGLGAAHAQNQLLWDATAGAGSPGAQDGSGTWSIGGPNWRNTGTSTDDQNFSNGDAVTFGAGSGAAGTITLSGMINTNSITFNAPGSGAYTISGGTAISMTNGAIVANANATISSVITGTGTLTKSGTGTLILTGTNLFNGLLDITQGAVSLRNAAAAGTTAGGVTVRNNAAVEFQGGFSYGSETLTLNGSGISGAGAVRNVSGNNTWAGGVSLASASTIRSDAGTLTLSGVISGANSLTIMTAASAAQVTFSGATSNSFTGPLNLNGGLLTLSKTPNSDSQLPQAIANNVTVNIGTGAVQAILRLDRNHQISDTGTVLNFAGSGSTAGIFRLNGFSDTVGTIKSTGGAGIIENFHAGNVSTITVNNATNDTFSGIIRNGGGAALNLAKANTGTLTLTGLASHTGSTSVKNGTLELSGAGALASTSEVILSTGGTLKVTNTAVTNLDDRIRDNAAITLRGGTLALADDGSQADYRENVSVTTAAAGASTISTTSTTTGTTTLTIGYLMRNKGATVNFTGTNLGLSTANRIVMGGISGTDHGLIGGWATTGNEFAKHDYTNGVTALTAADYVTTGEANWTFEANAKITGNTTLTNDRRVNSLNIAAAGTTNVNLNGESLRIESGGLLVSGTSAVTISNGTLTGGTGAGSTGEVILHQNSSALLDITATIADNGARATALVKSGTGTARLSSANSFTGGVFVNSGTLQVNHAAAINTANTLAVEGGTLDLNGNDLTVASLTSQTTNTAGMITNTTGGVKTLTAGGDNSSGSYSGQLGANLNFTKTGTGTFTLNQSNAAYAGVITVAQGTLATGGAGSLGGTAAAAKTVVQAGATLDISNGINRDETLEIAGHGVNGLGAIVANTGDSQNLRNAALTGHTTLGVNVRYDFDNVLAGNGYTLTKIGGGELALEGSGVQGLGDIHLKQGSTTWSGSADLGDSTKTLYVDSGAAAQFYNKAADAKRITLAGGTLRRAGTAGTSAGVFVDVVGGLKLAAGASSIAHSNSALGFQLNAIQRDVGATLNVDTSTGLATTDTKNDAGGILGGFITFGGTDWATNATNGDDGAIVAYTGYVSNTFSTATSNVNVSGTQNALADFTVHSLRFAAASTTLNLTGTNTVTSGGILITSTATGTGTTIAGGTLRGSAGGDLVVIVNSGFGATISSTIVDNTTATALTKVGTGGLTLTGNNTYTGGTYLTGGALIVNTIADTGNSNIGNSTGGTNNMIVFNGGTLALQDTGTDSVTARDVMVVGSSAARFQVGTGRQLELSGVVSEEALLTGEGVLSTNGFEKTGAGTLILSGTSSNTLTRQFDVSGGTVRLNKSGGATAIAGNVSVSGTLILDQSNQIADTSIVTLNSGSFLLNGKSETIGGLRGNAAVRNLAAANGSLETKVAAGETYVFNGGLDNGSGGGTLSYTKSGAGTQIFTYASSYTGTTTLTEGTLQLGNGDTLGSIDAASNVVFNGGRLAFARSSDITFSNQMSGTGTFAVTGAGSVYINSGTNTYAGTTEVLSGALFAMNTTGSATGSSTVVVTGTGILGGTGRIGGHTIVRDGGQIGPGNGMPGGGIGTLTLGSLTVNRQTASTTPSIFFEPGLAGVTFYNDAAGIAANMGNLSAYYATKINEYENESAEHDRLIIEGALNLDSGAIIQFHTNGTIYQAGDVIDLMDWATLNLMNAPGDRAWSVEQDLILPTLLPGLSWDRSLFESNGILVVIGAVPEPGRAMLLMLGLAGLVLRRRRRE